MKINGLEDYGIHESDLETNYNFTVFEIKIFIHRYTDLGVLRSLTPKSRRSLVQQKSREAFKNLLIDYPNKDVELIGTKIKPIGIVGKLTGGQIVEFKKNHSSGTLVILSAENLKKLLPRIEKTFYSVKGMFIVKIEGFEHKKTKNLVEERILLVKAHTIEEAKKLAEIEFHSYSDYEYLNSDFRLTKWDFHSILGIYETDVSEIDDSGTEIFSETRKKKVF